MTLTLAARFGYGQYKHKPWITALNGDIELTTAPDALVLRTPAHLQFDEGTVFGIVSVAADRFARIVDEFSDPSDELRQALPRFRALADRIHRFQQLLSLRNDLGLHSEEYEPRSGRLIGSFPQAFSYLALIHSASVLAEEELTPRAATNGKERRPRAQPRA